MIVSGPCVKCGEMCFKEEHQLTDGKLQHYVCAADHQRDLNKEKLFVIKIVNADNAPLRFWYRRKGGELYICRYVKETGYYRTFQSVIPDEETYGDIHPDHAFVVTEFGYNEDSY